MNPPENRKSGKRGANSSSRAWISSAFMSSIVGGKRRMSPLESCMISGSWVFTPHNGTASMCASAGASRTADVGKQSGTYVMVSW